MNKTWYLGPLGNLHGLVCPEPGVQDSSVRYGGVHQALSGARTMDITGHRRDYSFSFTYLDKEEFEWLNALHTRMVPGPFYLLDPRYKNRVSPQASTLDAQMRRSQLGLEAGLGVGRTVSRDFPDEISYGTHSLELTTFATAEPLDTLRVDSGALTPVTSEETVTGSWYIRCPESGGTQDISLYFDYYDADGLHAGTSTEQAFTATDTWSRVSHTTTAPAGVAAVVFSVALQPHTNPIRFAAPQIETGDTATAWEQGRGVARVLLDQLDTSSPRYPLTDCSLTLLEA